jgi:tRNA G18 (ribose-2'-O)-methylase SpoU
MKVTFVLDNIRSAFNIGSVFRTADGLGFDIHLIGITPIPYKDSKLEKTSLSSLEFVNWKYFDKAEDWFKYTLIKKEKDEHNLILAIEETKDFRTTSLFNLKNLEIEKFENIYIILGHEIKGVDKYLLEKADKIVQIPMYGQKNSLNVASCAGIVGYKVKELLVG